MVSDQLQTNPFESPNGEPNPCGQAFSGFQRSSLMMLVVVLLARGGLMTFEWGLHLLSGLDVSSHFYRAMILKDGIYGLTALVGGFALVIQRRIGWWSSTIHWFWYISCEVLVVLTAEAFAWQFPVRQHPPQLLTTTFGVAVVALALLFWNPTMSHCGVNRGRRAATAGSSLAGCLAIGLLVNWWSCLK